MSRRTVTIAIAAIAAVAFATAVVTSSMGGDSGQTHTMPGGQTMEGDTMAP